MKKKLVLLSLSLALIFVFVTACGSAPTLGNPVDNYDEFTCLTEEALPGTDDKKIQVFVPKGGSTYSGNDYITATANGIDIQIRLANENGMKDVNDSLKKYIQSYGNLATPSLLAAEEDISKPEMLNDDKTARVQGLRVKERYDKTYATECITCFVTRLDEKTVVEVSVTVSSDRVTKETNKTLEELKAFYNVDFYYDKDKAEKLAKKYTDNPPKTQKEYVGGFLVEIPRDWKKDTSTSTTEAYYYGPNGKATPTNNLICAYNYIGQDAEGITDKSLETLIKKMYSGMSVSFKKATCPIEGGTAMYGVMSKGGVRMSGYYVFANKRLIAIYVASSGKPTAAQEDTLTTAFESLTEY